MTSLSIGKIFGVEVKLHYTWFFIVILLAWSLVVDYFPSQAPGNHLVLGILAALLLFDCVLLHELSHALVAKHEGLDVKGITLFFFGGIASASEEGLTPEKEFKVAIAGPLFSLAISSVFYFLTLPNLGTFIYLLCDYLFKINALLALFNLLPGFPLDGGRLFRALAWKATGDLRKATRMASFLGKFLGGIMVFYGLIQFFEGLWYVLLGGFLYLLAEASEAQVEIKSRLEKKKLKEFISKNYEVLKDENVETLVQMFKKENKIFLCEKGTMIVDFDKVSKIPRYEWPVKLVKEVSVKVKPLKSTENPYNAIIEMQKQGANALPVFKNKKIVGIVNLDSLLNSA